VAFLTDPRAIAGPTRALLDYEVEIGDFVVAPKTEGLFRTEYWDAAAAKAGK
jgi:hypothetical protein